MQPKSRYAIFPHCKSRQPTGRGYVVRPINDAGEAEDFHNYEGIAHLIGRTYATKRSAEQACDKINNAE